MTTCSECTLINAPNALICEACSALLGGSCGICEPSSNESDSAFLVTAQRLWDGQSDVTVTGECGVCAAVVDGKIAYVGLLEHLPQSLRHLPATHHHSSESSTLMPGLIDCHVHLEFSPAHDLHNQPRLSPNELMAKMRSRARAMLSHGITTCRDLGGRPSGALALRAAIRNGECEGPRVLCAGAPITRPRGHCWQWGGEAATEADIQRVVRSNVSPSVGADVIKIMATGGVRTAGTNPAEAAFSEREICVAVEAAHQAGRKVAAHAHGVGGIAAAARAGVDTIEHCSWVDSYGRWERSKSPPARTHRQQPRSSSPAALSFLAHSFPSALAFCCYCFCTQMG